MTTKPTTRKTVSLKPELNPADILLEWPLYRKEKWSQFSIKSLRTFRENPFQIDAFCVTCKKVMPFKTNRSSTSSLGRAYEFSVGEFDVFINCGRCGHRYTFNLRANKEDLFKIGQYPSLADISNEKTARYRDMLSKEDASEFYKAIGLAAHGIGVGSYVYLRRIFERLIYGRFNLHKESESWNEEDFLKLRMDEKINFLKSHIPAFLYANRKVYSVLSKGIHEMSEKECLGLFDVLKKTIILILEEDKKLKEEQKAKDELTAAIAKL